jgi:hypothetical protein
MSKHSDGLWELASSQHGLVLRQQALNYMNEAVLARLVGPHGRWHIPLRSVYATFTGELSPTQRRYAAWMYAGPEAMITGLTGCLLYAMRKVPDSDTIRLLIPHHRRRQSRDFVVVQRARFYPVRSRIIDDVPVAPLPRCVVDATRELRELDPIRGLMMEAVQRRMVPISLLQTELELGTMQWSARPRLVIGEMIRGARSVAEAEFIGLMGSSKVLPPMHHNCTLLVPDGSFLAVPDGYIKDVGLAGEIQSLEHHLASDEQEGDMGRRARMSRHNVMTIEARPKRLTRDPSGLLADFEATYLVRAEAGERPRVLLQCREECPLAHESDVGTETPRKAN